MVVLRGQTVVAAQPSDDVSYISKVSSDFEFQMIVVVRSRHHNLMKALRCQVKHDLTLLEISVHDLASSSSFCCERIIFKDKRVDCRELSYFAEALVKYLLQLSVEMHMRTLMFTGPVYGYQVGLRAYGHHNYTSRVVTCSF